jgi:hypothetical protein
VTLRNISFENLGRIDQLKGRSSSSRLMEEMKHFRISEVLLFVHRANLYPVQSGACRRDVYSSSG